MAGAIILVVVAAFLLRSAFLYRTIRERRRAWHTVLTRLGMHLVEDHAKGEIAGFQVKIHPWLESGKCRIRIWLGDTSIETMHADNYKPGLHVAGARYIDTGDFELEQRLRLRGRNQEVLALLDAETRHGLMGWVQLGLRIETAMIIFEHSLDEDENLVLEQTVMRLIQLARRVSCPSDQVLSRLGRNAVEDPLASVRLRCLEALLETPGDRPEVANALALARLDKVQMNASIARLAHEGTRMPEVDIIRLLETGRDAVSQWAARLLGEVGTRDAVEPLIAHQSAKNDAVRGAVLRALQQIRERLGQDGATGRLSLSAGSGGELSHTVEGGAVSLASKDRGQP